MQRVTAFVVARSTKDTGKWLPTHTENLVSDWSRIPSDEFVPHIIHLGSSDGGRSKQGHFRIESDDSEKSRIFFLSQPMKIQD